MSRNNPHATAASTSASPAKKTNDSSRITVSRNSDHMDSAAVEAAA
jgi:hypothetical protein